MKNRRSIRLKEYDYAQDGAYFITICTQNRDCVFEQYPVLKTIVLNEWQNIPNRFPNVKLDEFIIMPNHIHGIINIPVGAGLAPALNARSYPDSGLIPQKLIGYNRSISKTSQFTVY